MFRLSAKDVNFSYFSRFLEKRLSFLTISVDATALFFYNKIREVTSCSTAYITVIYPTASG